MFRFIKKTNFSSLPLVISIFKFDTLVDFNEINFEIGGLPNLFAHSIHLVPFKMLPLLTALI